MHADNEARIVDSWNKNASPWVAAVRGGQIESRALVTDRAIVEAVSSVSPRTVLDAGCGEGWLVRKLSDAGIDALGVDAVPDLIQAAKAAGGHGEFQVASYEEIASGGLGRRFDVVVCNFSLLGKASVDKVLGAASSLINPHGAFVVQTLHPVVACGDMPYSDGWRKGSWSGFSSEFTDPAPWYFRTLESWISLFIANGLQLVQLLEPLCPDAQQPASVIFVAGVNA